MEDELKTLPKEINIEENSIVDLYFDKTPMRKSSWNMLSIIGIFIVVFIVIVGIGLYFCCCQSGKDEHNEGITRMNSDTSNVSNLS
jgi:hypothetical protein